MADLNDRDMLSQEEIDALLRAAQEGAPPEPSAPEQAMIGERGDVRPSPDGASTADERHRSADGQDRSLETIEADVLGEIGNISFGSASTALSQILNQKVEITTPFVEVIETRDFEQYFPYPLVAVLVDYTEGLSGTNALVLRARDASIIADLMMGGDGTTAKEAIDDLALSAIQEAMNQMMGSAATAMSQIFGGRVNISPPVAKFADKPTEEALFPLSAEKTLVRVAFRLKIGTLVDSTIMQLIPVPFAKGLVVRLMNGTASDAASASQSLPPSEPSPSSAGSPQSGTSSVDRPLQNASRSASPREQNDRLTGTGDVQPVVFPDLSAAHGGVSAEPDNLKLLLDVPLEVTVELGRTKRLIRDILALSPGSIVELDKLAGEPVDILVNHKLIARGEVVVIDENFGVRVTQIVSAWERLGSIE